LNVLEYLAHPGKRFPLLAILPPSPGETDDLRAVGEIRMEGEAFAQLSTLYIDAQMTTTIAQPCGRCLKPLETPFSLRESFTVPIPPTGDEVDIRPTVVSLILSAHNPHVYCRPDCRGLCSKCGADLNEESIHTCAKANRESHRLGDLFSP